MILKIIFMAYFKMSLHFLRFLDACTSIYYSHLFCKCGPGLSLKFNYTYVSSPATVKVGSNFKSFGSLYLFSDNGSIVMGDSVSINTNVFIGSSGGEIIIGNNVLIGPNVVLRSASHSYTRTDIPIATQGHKTGSIAIGDDVWIGANVFIKDNVEIGHSSIVAAGSTVTKNVPPFSVVGGVPAALLFARKDLTS